MSKIRIKFRKKFDDPKLQLIVTLMAYLYLFKDVYKEVFEKYGEDFVTEKIFETANEMVGEL